jgi:hypothetical protein
LQSLKLCPIEIERDISLASHIFKDYEGKGLKSTRAQTISTGFKQPECGREPEQEDKT